MRFSEILTQAKEWLQREGRLTYRALKLEFDLDDEQLDVLKDELVKAKRLAIDEDNEVLVWTGNGDGTTTSNTESQPPPATYTPPHPTWLSVSGPNSRPWNPVAQPTGNAKPSPPCLPTSKARPR